jgi:glutathione synthase/RimK-type ligase-like ATP-grasp enzyme
MKRCALLTCDNLQDKLLDEDRLEKALTRRGWTYEWVPWRQQGVDWNSFQCAIVRTTWDYTEDPEFFLQQMQVINDSSCELLNSLALIRWNFHKIYLKELQEKGVSVIPTQWCTVGEQEEWLAQIASLSVSRVVVKPQVGAGAKNTFLLTTDQDSDLQQSWQALRGQAVMLQPFVQKVQEEGEYSAHFFNKEFSHLVLKTPKGKDFRSQEEFGSHVRKVEMSQSSLDFCDLVLAQIPEPTLYARVDFIHNDRGEPWLNELELIEPSLYFRYDENSADRMVEALDQWWGVS